MKSELWKQCGAEFLGTFFLVFIGCGSVIVHQLAVFHGTELKAVSLSFIPIAFGGVVSVMIYACGHISGAHFNPAVTIAFAAARKLSIQKVFPYLGAQFCGAVFASFLHSLVFGSAHHSFGVTALSLSPGGGIVIEFLLSFLLMFVIIAVATDARAVGDMAGIAIGATVAICAMMGGSLTGASMNPARSLGPAILAGSYAHLWLYLFVPVLGTVAAALIYEKIRCDREKGSEGPGGCC